jgi:hypothetical protein
MLLRADLVEMGLRMVQLHDSPVELIPVLARGLRDVATVAMAGEPE